MELVGLSGYGLAFFAYLIFFLLILTVKQKSFSSKVMLVLTSAIFVSSLVSALQLYKEFSLIYVFAVEAIKLVFISFFILGIKFNPESLESSFRVKPIQNFLMISTASLALSIFYLYYYQSFILLFLTLLSLNLYPLILLEQLFRNANKQYRWSLWPLIIALGTLLIFDFVLYAEAALINHVNFNLWYIRGFMASILMPLFLLGSKRIKNLTVALFVSREVVFYSSMLIITGAYLFLLALTGYIIRYIDGQWSEFFSLLFLSLGLLVLVVLMITDSFRRKVKVFISKHFFANKYEYRDEWIKVTQAIENIQDENIFDHSCRVMSDSLQVHQCAFLQLSAFEQLQLKSNLNLVLNDEQTQELSRLVPFCQDKHWIIDIREYQNRPDSYEGLTIDCEMLLTANIEIVIPIYKHQNLFGFFVLSGPTSSVFLNWEDRDYLFAVSKQLANGLFLQEAQNELAQTQQFSMFNRMSAFVLHDLKNIQAQLSLINKNSERHRDNPEFINDVFETVVSANNRLQKVTSQLRNKSRESKKPTLKLIEIKALLNEIVELRNQQKPLVNLMCDDDIYLEIDREQLYSIISHLIQNAQDASQDNGRVEVVCQKLKNTLILSIEDDGCGMSVEFIQDSLFKPFVTTKGNAGMGIGVFEAKQFVSENNGQLTVESKIDVGSKFTIKLHCNE